MNVLGILQQLGRSLMLPTMTIPLAAVLLWLGILPWEQIHLSFLNDVFTLSGYTVFHYMPVIFAVGVSLGLTQSAGLAGMSAMLGYFIFTQVVQSQLGLNFQLGVAGGILIGLLTAYCFHLCKDLVFPEYIQFFGGTRMIPLLSGTLSLIAALIMVFVGPLLEIGMEKLSSYLFSLGGFGTFLFGFTQRLLVPSGLHHLLNNFFWFQLGAYERAPQEMVYGDLPRFFSGDTQAGIYMAGIYPITMFALPAIAFAIIHESRQEYRSKVKATFLIAAVACFLTGVSEPIEFAFLFVAPYLFLIHAFLSGTAMWVAYELGIRYGFSYSAGGIDYLINYHLASHGLWIVPMGLFYGIIYYFLFRYAIRRFRIPTPGREEGTVLADWANDISTRTPLIVQALGGHHNIIQVEACMTRLRLTLVKYRLIDIRTLKNLGAAGVIHLGGGNVQVVFGTFSDMIRQEMVKAINLAVQPIQFCSPVKGKMIPLEDVPDPLYAKKIIGKGVAFLPETGYCVSPIKGEIIHVYPSGHALGIKTVEGLEVLIHIGIDSLYVHTFSVVVREGDFVQEGQLLVKFNLKQLKLQAKSIATMMIITNPNRVKSWTFAPFELVKRGQSGVMIVELKDHIRIGDELA